MHIHRTAKVSACELAAVEDAEYRRGIMAENLRSLSSRVCARTTKVHVYLSGNQAQIVVKMNTYCNYTCRNKKEGTRTHDAHTHTYTHTSVHAPH